MENKQLHLYPEIKVLNEKERLDRVLKYELNLPEDISTFTASNESRKKFVENWSKIKSEAEKLFAGGETYEIFEVENQRCILKYYGEDQLVDTDPLLGPTVESSGSFEVCILSDPDGVKVDASQTRQGWKNVELRNGPLQGDDLTDRNNQILEVPMKKNGIDFSIKYKAKFNEPVLRKYLETVQIAQSVVATTPVGVATKELCLFDARSAQISKNLPSGGIDQQITEAVDMYIKDLGISPELVKQIHANEIDVESIVEIREALELYVKIRKECGEAKYFGVYDHQAHILKVVSNLLNPEYVAKFYYTESKSEYESNDGRGTRWETDIYHHANTVRVDGVVDFKLENYSLSSKTVKKMKELRLVKDPANVNVIAERHMGPAMTVAQRLEMARTLLDNEIEIPDPSEHIQRESYSCGIYHHLIWWKQYEVLQKAFELTKNIDFKKHEEDLISTRKQQFGEIKSWVKQIDNDNAIQGSYYSPDKNEEYYERRSHLGTLRYQIEVKLPILDKDLSPEGLTDEDALNIYRAKKYILGVLAEEGVKNEYVFDEPILPIGTRVMAKLVNVEGKMSLAIEDVPSEHWKVGKSKGDFAPHKLRQESKTSRFEVEAKLSEISDWSTKIALPEGVSTVESGEYPVEIIEISRKGHKYWKVLVLTPEFLNNERVEVLTEIKENLPLRSLAREISDEDGLYGMPVDKDGKPCDESEADHWVMYMKYHKWANSYPDAYILTRMQGFRSKSTGTTFEELVKDYNR